MRLRAKLDAFKADFEVGKPPYNVSRSVVETMHRATAAPSAVMVREDAHPRSEASSFTPISDNTDAAVGICPMLTNGE